MAQTQSQRSGLFSGLVLVSVGFILLLHYYSGLDLHQFFWRWWPLLIIFWGVVKLYERTAGLRLGGSGGGGITGGEVLLVLGMLALMGMVVAAEHGKQWTEENITDIGDKYAFDLDVPSQAIPTNSRISVLLGRGDLIVRASDDSQIRVSAKRGAHAWNETEADRLSKSVKVDIVKNGDAYEVRPTGYDLSKSQILVDMEMSVPRKSPLTIKTDRGDISISDVSADISITLKNGDVDVRNTTGDVSVDTRKGDIKITDTTGNVKVSGKGGEVEAINATGSLTVDGDFYGPVRADKIAKGVRLINPKSDMTLASLAGHMEAGPGNLDIVNAPGNLNVRTRDTEISLENPGGKVDIENRNAEINVRFSSAPKDDVRISNSSSGISLTLPGSSSFEIQADCHSCDVDSEFPGLGPTKAPSGDASVAGKFGTGRGPKITLKTSYGNIAIRRTSIPVPPKPPTPAPPAKAVPPVPPAEEH